MPVITTILLLSVLFAATGSVLQKLMKDRNQLFGFIPEWVMTIKDERTKMKLLSLIQCDACLAGQSALWLSIPALLFLHQYNLLNHFAIIILSIYLNLKVLNKL